MGIKNKPNFKVLEMGSLRLSKGEVKVTYICIRHFQLVKVNFIHVTF